MLTIPELIKETCQSVQSIDAKTAYAEQQANDGVFVDVREPGEVSVSPVAGSVNIPRGVLEMKITEICTEADTPIYIHCASGARAKLAAKQLQRMGYTQVQAISCALKEVNSAQDARAR